jgi:hypothetical protein
VPIAADVEVAVKEAGYAEAVAVMQNSQSPQVAASLTKDGRNIVLIQPVDNTAALSPFASSEAHLGLLVGRLTVAKVDGPDRAWSFLVNPTVIGIGMGRQGPQVNLRYFCYDPFM